MLRPLPAVLAVLIWLVVACAVWAQDYAPILPTNLCMYLDDALDHLNMTRADLAFEKDVGEPRFVVDRVRRMLSDPLDLPRMGDEVLVAARGNADGAAWRLAVNLMDLLWPVGVSPAAFDAPAPPAGLDPTLARALTAFYEAARGADHLARRAIADVPPPDMTYAAASLLGGIFAVEDHPDVRDALVDMGIPVEVVDKVVAEGNEIDPEPSATRLLDIAGAVRREDLLAAGEGLRRAVAGLERAVAGVAEWPAKPVTWQTPLGAVRVGSLGPDDHRGPALLILDPGGSDAYTGQSGVADGRVGRPLSAVVDLGGDDRYDGAGMLGQGTALFGVCVVLDAGGDDIYRAAYVGQGAGLFGAAALEDRSGRDVYRAQALGQAAGYVGFGFLSDGGGGDLYDVGFYGQGFAGVMAAGLLVDRAGNDRYLAGGRRPDFERHDDRYLSLAQGFAIGMRPFAGGGIAALVDLAGNDTYEADVYGQGVSYWYSVGMLLDAEGHDTYQVYHYGQGSGIHLSSGLLWDGAGNDLYTGYILGQGNAHDYAVGMLVESGGNDTYTADHFSQGRAMNNSFAWLLDVAGKDGYFARNTNTCQGVGHDGWKRESGSLGVLTDLAGKDTYSCGAEDGARMVRPDFGIVYDVE